MTMAPQRHDRSEYDPGGEASGPAGAPRSTPAPTVRTRVASKLAALVHKASFGHNITEIV